MKLKTFCWILLGAALLAACTPMPEIPQAPGLDVSLPVSGTEEVWNSSDYQGKPVLLAVMATWCPWCKRSLPALDAANEAFADQVEVVGIFIDEDMDLVEKVKKDHHLKTKALYQGGEAAQDLQVQGFPHIMLFDKNHKLVKVWSGYSDTLAEEYQKEINKLLK